jgi:hypothetical protein
MERLAEIARSRSAIAIALQPVRDISVGDINILSEDTQLDIIGTPYPNIWTLKSGDPFEATQIVWADPNNGNLGFVHESEGA